MKKVSIIIPTYKGGYRLVEAVESVLGQSYSNTEIIVVDDNDPNSEFRKQTEKLIEKYVTKGLIYMRHEKNMNGSAARNTGIKKATGDYISFLDDDDIYYKDRIEKCVFALETNEEYDGVYTGVDIYVENNKVDEIHPFYSGKVWRELMMNESMIGTGSNLFFRARAVAETGEFDENLIRYQDLDYMIRFLKDHALLAFDEILVKKRNTKKPNIPNYIVFSENKNVVFRKYETEIAELTAEERQRYYSSHYKSLLGCALNTRNRKNIEDAEKKLKSIRALTVKERISVLCPWMYILNNKIVYQKQKNIYRKKKE